MKILKKANQKNLVVKKEHYTVKRINELLKSKTIFYFAENGLLEKYDEIDTYDMKKLTFRVFTENCKEIKVLLDEYNDYNTAVLTNDNKMLYVEI